MNYFLNRLHQLTLLSLFVFLSGQIIDFWFLELFSHFLVIYVMVWGLSACLQKNKKRKILAFILFFLGSAYLLAPFKFHSEMKGKTLIWYNVNLNNTEYYHLGESYFLAEAEPDLIAVAELNFALPQWQTLLTFYPFGCEVREDTPFALAIRSKKALLGCEIIDLEGYPAIRAFDGETHIYALHPPPPINAELAGARKRYLAEIGLKIAQDKKVLVVGDLNSSPYSPIFRTFLKQANLKQWANNFHPTWFYLLNLDHALARQPIKIEYLNWRYSDHRPLKIYF